LTEYFEDKPHVGLRVEKGCWAGTGVIVTSMASVMVWVMVGGT
jgi:hypothetical protein